MEGRKTMINIIKCLIVILTVGMENGICIGGYVLLHESERKTQKKWSMICFTLVIVLFSILDIWNYSLSIVNTFETILAGIWQGIIFLLYTKKNPFKVFGWTFFINGIWLVLSVPIVLVRGLIIGKGIDANLYPDIWWVLIRLVLIGCLVGICINKKDFFISLKKSYQKHETSIYYFFIVFEWVTAIYIMNIAINKVKSSTLILSFAMIICMALLLLILLVKNQYIYAEKERNLYESKEKSLRSDYELLSEELRKNRKINHDHKYDLNYLYTCLENGSLKQGMHYIEQKIESYRVEAKGEVWTGIECVDVLLNYSKKKAMEENIIFDIKGDFFVPPMEEYDFFAVLGNLVDNALEAAEKCNGERRFVRLQMYEKNEMFFLQLENGYAIEPKQNKEIFLTSKKENGHGFGIEIVRESVERKGGRVEFKYEEGKFTTEISFGL